MFLILPRTWLGIYGTILLLSCSDFVISTKELELRATIPAPIVIPASQDWDGSDGPWSSFIVQIGSPPQNVKTLLSTASTETWAVAPEGCIPDIDPADCTKIRGRIYNYNSSTSWVPNLANTSSQVYKLGLEDKLGYTGLGRYGFDSITLGYNGDGGPSLSNQTVASISTIDFWLGIFGVNPRPSNFTSYNDPIPSFMSNLREQNMIPSTSWSYTAGNRYRFNNVLGSLTLGGYDTSKFEPHSVTWALAPANDRDLVVQLQSIKSGTTSLLSETIPVFLDSTVPYLYLPATACTLFETAFGLAWDNETQLYLLTESQHTSLKSKNPSITFSIGNLTSTSKVDITFPYSAFDLMATYPLVQNATRYFPLKRASDVEQYTLGRTFFQEAYVIADYDRQNFSVSPCKWDAQATQNIVAILPPASSNSTSPGSSSTSKSSIPLGPVIGGAVGGVVLLIVVICVFIFFRRRKGKENTDETATDPAAASEDPCLKPELDGFGVSISKPHPEGQELDGNERDIYEKSAGEVFPNDSKHLGTEQAVELGGSGRRSPVYEMAADEVAVEMPSTGRLRNDVQRSTDVNHSEASSPGGGWSAASPASGRDSTTLVSPASGRNSRMLGVQGSPEAVSPASLDYTGRSPVDELWIPRS